MASSCKPPRSTPIATAQSRAALNKSIDSQGALNRTGMDNLSFIDFSVHPTKPGQMVYEGAKYTQELKNYEYPETALDANDYQKRLRFEELKKTKLEEMCNWKQKDIKGIKKNSYIKEVQKRNEKILTVADKNDLEKLEVYTDRFPLLELRKSINKVLILIHMIAFEIQSSKIFENSTIFIILVNCFFMMAADPTQDPTEFEEIAENVFLALYTIEMVVKILGLGFIMGEKAYIRDGWNILDFIIVVSSYPSLFEEKNPDGADEGGFSLAGLRSFRVLRPL